MDLLLKLVNKYAQATQTQASDFPAILHKHGLSGFAQPPDPGVIPQPDYSSKLYTQFINPALDAAGTQGKITMQMWINPDLSVTIKVTGDPTAGKVQAALQQSLGQTVRKILASEQVEPPATPLPIGGSNGWVVNYG